MRGGANGARLRLAPQKDWAANNPAEAGQGAATPGRHPERLQRAAAGGKKISLADLIVLGGAAAIEKAAKSAGYDVQVPFTPGRTDATQAQTDVASFAVLEPAADGFRNYFGSGQGRSPAELLIDRANMLTLTRPRDDRAGRRPARAGRQRRSVGRTASSPTGPAPSPTTSS